MLLSSSSAVAEYQRTGERFPVALLWLPYAALTLLLSALLVASFVHFHCKNGHKYKKRQRSTKEKENGNENGGEKTGNVSGVRRVAFSDDQTPGVAVIDCSSAAVTCFRYTSPPGGQQPRHQIPVIGWVDDDDQQRRLRKCNGVVGGGEERPKNQHQVRKLSRLTEVLVKERSILGEDD